MDKQRKNIFRTKRAFVFVGIFSLICISGIVLWARKPQIADVIPGNNNPIPIINDANQFPPVSGDSGKEEGKYALNIELSDGKPQPQTIEALPLATGEPLSSEEIQTILSRLPTLPPASDQQADFNLPQESLPPPRAGNVVKETFPPLETEPTPGAVEAAPLQILRFSPEGEIPIAPLVSVTFNQPMVPLGTIGDFAATDLPVQIEPALPGTWRWLGTKTLTFEYDSKLIDRLPKATEYHVTVPAGTKSLTGQLLAESVSWTFKTPPPKIVTTYPDNSPQPLDPIFFIAFDQRIDPTAVLKTISVKAGSQAVNVMLANQTETEKDDRVSQLIKDTPEGRWLAFRANQPLPAETNVSVTIESGTPSAEGPLTTTQAQSFSFSTYAPLRIEEYRCSGYENRCPPLDSFYIRFNNPLDTNTDVKDLLQVEPEIPGVSANIYGNIIEISGQTKGQTTYTVTVSGKAKDIFGQQLGKDLRLPFKVGKAESLLANPGQNFLTLDPTVSKKVFSVYAINYNKLNLNIYAVQPSDWPGFRQYLRAWQQTNVPAKMPGVLVANRTLNLNLPTDTLSQVDINLSQYLRGQFGHFVVIVEPPPGVFENENDKWRRYSQTIITWVQITQIGLDAYNDHSEMAAWATDLKDGSPLTGVSIRPNNSNSTILSDSDGVARFKIPTGATYLVASKGADQAILPRSTYFWDDEVWSASPPVDTLSWYVFDDRQMYRPNEEVHIKGWLRLIGGGQNGDVGLVGDKLNSINYQVADSQGNPLSHGQVKVNALGGFDFVFTVPQATKLGTAQLDLIAEGDLSGLGGLEYVHQFQIQEFRRPEFEVTARNETSGPYFVDAHATLAVDAKYYAGGGLPNADVTWQITTSPGSYSPPNWPDFTFGNWQPWWFDNFRYPGPGGDTQTKTFTGKTDALGTHYLDLAFNQEGNQVKDPQPQSVIAQATVMDVNRQAWSSTTTLLVHPADVYVGLRSDRYFVERGTPLKVDFIVTDLDGNPVENRSVEITAGRLEWKIK
ncbi:MAG TPA: Ig-like domain-containing protein, partial [Anaerolineales bacterium]|nr:Ig-like domain-containing protein [Anaerolineales bacterium]